MGVRRESVILELQDDFTAKAARAAAAAQLLSHSVDDMGTHSRSASTDVDRIDKSTSQFAKTAGGSTSQIDRYSGRLGVLAEAAITLGPALIPLGASTIPVLTASLAGLGAAAGGIGTAILAFKGLGDGIKALDAYNLSPTVANLEKLRQAEQSLGPAGAQFLHFIDGLEPQLKSLQNLARAGLFPGMEQGLTDLLQRLPLVRGVVKSLSTEMGTLAAEAGHSLSSSEWRPFFQYVRATAAPTLDAFAHSAGNVALGLANLLVAFNPLSRSFSGGFEQMTASFADWSKHLDSNQGFQNFLLMIQQSGPQAVAFLGSLIHALVGLLRAAQPWGSVVLPILTDALKLFTAIADSSIGPALYGAAAGMILYSRGVKLAAASQKDFAATFAKIPELLAAVAVVDALINIKTANDQLTASIKASQAALRAGDQAQITQDLSRTNAELQKIHDTTSNVDWFGAPSWDKAKQIIPLVEGEVAKLNGTAGRLTFTQGELKTAMQEGGGAADLFGHDIGLTGKQMAVAAGSAKSLSGALAELNGWFDKRQAVRDYRKSVTDLSKALKDGFQPKDAQTLDAMGRGIIQVANSIKDPVTKSNFLAGARKQLEDISKTAGPAAQKAIQRVIDQFDKTGVTHPPTITPQVDTKPAQQGLAKITHGFGIMKALSGGPTVTANDNPFQQTFGTVKQNMAAMNKARATPTVSVNPSNSFSILGTIRNAIDSLHDKTVTIRTVHAGGPGPQPAGSADGSTVPKDRLPYADRYLYLLAPGEEVISNRHGQADRNRSLLKAINAGRLADGGTSGGHPGNDGGAGGGSHYVLEFAQNVHLASTSLKALRMATDAETKVRDKAKANLSNIRSASSSLSSTVSGSFGLDSVFNLSAASSNPWAAGASGGSFNPTANLNAVTAQAQGFIADVKALQAKGVSGAALQAILAQGPTVVHLMAQMSQTDLSAEVSAYNQASALVSQASSFAGTAVYSTQEAAAVKELKGIRRDLHILQQAVKVADKANQKGHGKTAQAAASHSAAAAAARRRGRGH